MESRYKITRISPADSDCLHFYYDICPESPDGGNVVYFRFNGRPVISQWTGSGPGSVVTADAGSGDVLFTSPEVNGDTHSGARAQWLDDSHIIYCRNETGGKLETVKTDIVTGHEQCFRGALRMLSPVAPLGLTVAHDFMELDSPFDDAVYLIDFANGATRRLFTLADALEVHPLGPAFKGAEYSVFMHTKWAPDGKQFFVMLSNSHRLSREGLEGETVHSVLTADPDGGSLRYVTEEHHHPIWGPDSGTLCYFRKNADGFQDFMIFPLPDGEPYPLIRNMKGKHASVSRDCTKVLTDVTPAYGWPEKGGGAIFLYDTARSEPEILATMRMPDPSQKGVHCHPVFSRNETRVYFNAMENGTRNFYGLDLCSGGDS